jgi:hypothetical protein
MKNGAVSTSPRERAPNPEDSVKGTASRHPARERRFVFVLMSLAVFPTDPAALARFAVSPPVRRRRYFHLPKPSGTVLSKFTQFIQHSIVNHRSSHIHYSLLYGHSFCGNSLTVPAQRGDSRLFVLLLFRGSIPLAGLNLHSEAIHTDIDFMKGTVYR